MDVHRRISASRRVPAPRDELYARLADLRGHWELAGRWVEPVELRADGGTVRVRGPLGLGRTVHTRLIETRPPERVAGEARIGPTLAAIQWRLAPAPDGGTLVTLTAEILQAGRVDRALLALGARRWLAGRFRDTLQRLG
jgi:uncharacterized protein YndB with AHSA1/START domain